MTALFESLARAQPRQETNADRPMDPLAGPVGDEGDAVAPAVAMAAEPAELDATADPGYALLTVQRRGDDGFAVMGSRGADPEARLGEIVIPAPRLGLGTLAGPGEARTEPRDIDDLLYAWSEELPEALLRWLARMAEASDRDETRLVIWDATGFDIPWEALLLTVDPEPDPQPLGALVAVTRWTGDQPTGPGDTPRVARGGVVYYLDDTMRADQDVLSAFTARPSTRTELAAALGGGEPSLGLVYFGCHGTSAATFTELRLGEFRYRDFLRGRMDSVRDCRPMVMINACYAGRLFVDSVLRANVCGFAQIFVKRGASVVIAPTGPVESGLANGVARRIVETVSDDPSIPVSVALRAVRAEAAAARAAAPEDTATLKRYLYSMMYVCLGDPWATVDLERGRP